MKYFAILKDSLREARDSWVLLGLLAVTTLVILFVGTLSFKRQTAKKTMESFFTPLISMALHNNNPEKHEAGNRNWGAFSVDEVKVLEGDEDSPTSEYAVKVAARQFGLNGPNAPKIDHEANMKSIREFFADAEDLDYIKIEKIAPIEKDAAGNPPRYELTVKGTAKTHRLWATEPGLFFGALSTEELTLPLGFLLFNLAGTVIGIGSWIAVLMGIIITAFFIPNMLRKGTIDLLLAKPISRPGLLFYKYLGGLTFIFLTTAYAIGGMWLALGIRSGLWANGTFLLVFTITFFFAILYAISTFVAVLTRSVVATILITILAWFVLFLIGLAYDVVDTIQRQQEERDKRNAALNQPPRPRDPDWATWTIAGIRAAHAISPRTSDLNRLNKLIVQTDFLSGNLGDMSKFDTSKRNWWEALLVSTIWISIFLGLAMLWFYFKDY